MIAISVVDQVTPEILRAMRAVERPKPVIRAALEVIKQVAKRAFNDPSLRPMVWVAKVDGTPATLRKDQLLARSPTVQWVGEDNGRVGSDRVYARIHQYGGTIKPKRWKSLLIPGVGFRTRARIPARPYFPFKTTGDLTEAARIRVEEAMRIKLGL
jgi:phage gpG-like protein